MHLFAPERRSPLEGRKKQKDDFSAWKTTSANFKTLEP